MLSTFVPYVNPHLCWRHLALPSNLPWNCFPCLYCQSIVCFMSKFACIFYGSNYSIRGRMMSKESPVCFSQTYATVSQFQPHIWLTQQIPTRSTSKFLSIFHVSSTHSHFIFYLKKGLLPILPTGRVERNINESFPPNHPMEIYSISHSPPL